ncbi:MAG: glycosyltransferase [Candidatus Krumholzibacteriia bacterium]
MLQAADLFVLLPPWEGPVLLEAMAAGCPVAAYAIAGTREVVRPGREGALAPAGDPAALTRLVAELLEQPDRRLAMGRQGRELVIARHDLACVLARLEDLYRELAARRPR